MKARTIKVTVLKAEPKPPQQIQIVVRPVMTPSTLAEVARVVNAPGIGSGYNKRTKQHTKWAHLGIDHALVLGEFFEDPTPQRWAAVVKVAEALEAFFEQGTR